MGRTPTKGVLHELLNYQTEQTKVDLVKSFLDLTLQTHLSVPEKVGLDSNSLSDDSSFWFAETPVGLVQGKTWKTTSRERSLRWK